MTEIRIYEPRKENCYVCKVNQGIYLPYCRREDGTIFMPIVCKTCLDNLPYEKVPVETVMDQGYFFCPNAPTIVDKLLVIDPESFNPREGIKTRYGKKLLREGAKYYSKLTIGDVIKEQDKNESQI